MPDYRWTIQTPAEHIVEVQHAVHTGRVRIKVDGNIVFAQDDRFALWDSGFSHELAIDDTKWQMEICGVGTLTPEYTLQQVQIGADRKQAID